MVHNIAVIGDLFMLSKMFEEALRERCRLHELNIRAYDLPWPDEPMEHGYAVKGMDGLKEYMGKPDQVVELVGNSEILVTHLAPLSAGILDRLPKLKFVAVSRGGPVNIDMKAARERGVTVVNTPGRNASAVAEFTIGAILAETRNITRGHDALKRGEWRGDLYRADLAGEELCEMTVGLIGYGEVGRRVVKFLKAFGCRILVSDPYVQLSVDDLRDGVQQVSLERVLVESDVVSLHPRVTAETTKMMNRDTFAQMKKGAYFINTARGPLVDYDALYEAMVSGHLRGAMLETFDVEPAPADSRFLKLPNVTLTPHIAGASVRTVKYAAGLAAEEVRRYLDGEPALNRC
ncbi:2-hydroxyacid dehydrogenase [Aestuariivirga sp.]|uniref:2-hydroxyacid dehydrogenase n=1 Tax=Aestuariivirga sp. TaxID=2650926 RepID=UPI0039E6C6BD